MRSTLPDTPRAISQSRSLTALLPLIVLADALTHPTISFAHPGWKPAADHHDPERAVVTRKTLLDRLATDRNRVIGYHLPFPGIGFVERMGTAYRFVASS